MNPGDTWTDRWHFREHRPADLARLRDLDHLCFPRGVAYSTFELAGYLADPVNFSVVAEDRQGRIAGFIIADPGHRRSPAQIVTIDVHPRSRRAGLGSRLMAMVERRLAAMGQRRVRLQVAVDNEGAVRFYRLLRYTEIGLLKGYYARGMDAIVMEKHLGRGVRSQNAQ